MLEPGQLDVVVFPGGSGNGQAKAIGLAGLEALRKFVQAGGGYIGTCGGAFLGLQVRHALCEGEFSLIYNRCACVFVCARD